MTVFVQNKSGIIHETTEEIASDLVGRGDVTYVSDTNASKEVVYKKTKSKEAE